MRRRAILAAVVMSVLSLSAVSRAQTPSLDRILLAVERQIPGTMLDARGPSPSSGRKLRYEIKWMTPNGRIFWLSADANTGKILSG